MHIQIRSPLVHSFRELATALVCAIAAPSATAAYQVLLAGPPGTPGVQYFSIEAAIAAASDGDTVLLKDFLGGSALLDGKAITLGEFPGSNVELTSLTIRNIPLGKTVVVQDIALIAMSPTNEVRDCAGSVVLQRIQIQPESLGVVANPVPSLVIENCANVSLLRSTVVGRSTSGAITPGASAGVGLRAIASTVHVLEGSCRGGDGGSFENFYPSFVVPPVAGASAIELLGGRLELVNATASGGKGGAGGEAFQGGPCFENQPGGPGVRVEGTAWILGSTVTGGAGGTATIACGPSQPSAPPVDVVSGTLVEQARALRSIEVSSVSSVGGTVFVLLRGVPGEPVFLLKSPTLAATWSSSLNGLLFPAPPFVFVPLGTVPAAGFAQYAFTIPHGVLPTGIDAVGEFLQFVTADANAKPFLANPCAFTVTR